MKRVVGELLQVVVVVGLVGCGTIPGEGPDPTPSDSSSPTPTATGEPCVREPAAADRTRFAVTSYPYDADSNPAHTWQVWELSASGELARTDETFEMGRALEGRVVFTPDGELGFAAQEDGSVGVFRIDESGSVEVLETGLDDFYATGVVMDPTGSRVYVLDGNWRENGGGIYALDVDCATDAVTPAGLLAAARLPYGMVFVDETHAFLGAKDVLDIDSTAGTDAHLLEVKDGTAARLDSADAYGDDQAIIASVAVTADGQYGLLGDYAAFSGVPNRIAVVGLGPDTVKAVDVLTPVEDPVSMVASPFDDWILVASGFGDAVLALEYNPEAQPPVRLAGELAYSGAEPALPGQMVMIERGALAGHVLMAENVGVRQMSFTPTGPVDEGSITFAGVENIVGAIGVQP